MRRSLPVSCCALASRSAHCAPSASLCRSHRGQAFGPFFCDTVAFLRAPTPQMTAAQRAFCITRCMQTEHQADGVESVRPALLLGRRAVQCRAKRAEKNEDGGGNERKIAHLSAHDSDLL